MPEERQGFLGRWARRKTSVLQGKPLEEPALVAQTVQVTAEATKSPIPVQPAQHSTELTAGDAGTAEKALSLDDVRLLTKDSDFKPFMRGDVGPEVRNAAMKKLFTDPHYNVMDGLDIYIDDYSRSDPIPESMLRQMVGAKLLKFFDSEEDTGKTEDAQMLRGPAPLLSDNPNNPTPETVAQSDSGVNLDIPNCVSPQHLSQPEPSPDSGASEHDHAHSHLRLQPDHASPAEDAGRGTS